MSNKTSISETLEKGLRILDLFCADDTSFTLSELSRRLDINKTSVYRYVGALCHQGYLQKGEKDKRYRLGLKTIPLAHAFLQKAEIVQAIRPHVDSLHKQHNLHIDVGIIQNSTIYLVYRRESIDTLAFAHFTFNADMYNLATGKAAMAFMDDDKLAAILKQTDLKPVTGSTITDRDKLEKDLLDTRKRGYSTNKEEFLPGLIAMGAPIYDLGGSGVVGGVSFDSSSARFTMEQFEERYATMLMELSKTISAAISRI
jgi:IclR family pca regulon transcriptional regulator